MVYKVLNPSLDCMALGLGEGSEFYRGRVTKASEPGQTFVCWCLIDLSIALFSLNVVAF